MKNGGKTTLLKNFMKRYLFLVIPLILPLYVHSTEKSTMINMYEFTYAGIDTLVIDGSLYDIQIVGESRHDVSGRMESSDSHILRHTQIEKTLKIWYQPVLSIPSFKKHSLELRVPDTVRIEIKNSSGSVDVRSMRADLLVRSTSGRQHFIDNTGKIGARSSSGAITVISHQGQLTIQTTSGKMSGESILLSENSLFKSTSGDISIVLENTMEECSYDLSASSGSLSVASVTVRKKMTRGNGPLLITGKSTSGSQKYTTGR